MESNLKNFPHSETQGYPEEAKTKSDFTRHAIAVSDWYEDFERSLRDLFEGEKQNYATALALEDSCSRDELLSRSWGRIQLFNQIFGEEWILWQRKVEEPKW